MITIVIVYPTSFSSGDADGEDIIVGIHMFECLHHKLLEFLDVFIDTAPRVWISLSPFTFTFNLNRKPKPNNSSNDSTITVKLPHAVSVIIKYFLRECSTFSSATFAPPLRRYCYLPY